MRIAPIIPTRRREASDDPAFLFELKYDGFRGIANTIDGLNLKSIVRLSARLLITGAILPLVRAGSNFG
jgi:ATP-dependent DNA ligase